MKIIQTGDLHIGKALYEFSLLEDQSYILKQILEICEKEEADALLITGDLYDRGIPPGEAVRVFNDFLTNLVKIGVEVYIISGNHDSPERISFAQELIKESGVYIAGEFEKEVTKISKEDVYGKINFYLLPFAKPAWMRHYGYEGSSFQECVKKVMDQIEIEEKERNVLITHHFVAGVDVKIEESESEYPISVGGLDYIDYHVFDKFDYTALGHIHRPQKVALNKIRYGGSPLKYSFSEANQKKAVLLINLEEKGNLSIREIPLVPKRDVRVIKGELQELIKDEVVSLTNKEDYLQVTLTDQNEMIDPLGRLRSVYPNVCQLILQKNIRHEGELTSMAKERTCRSPLEIFEEFYEKVTDVKLDGKRREAMIEVIEKAGGRED
ncbi:MAG: exonuclease SbcCD subunit D [Acetivibrio sp.]